MASNVIREASFFYHEKKRNKNEKTLYNGFGLAQFFCSRTIFWTSSNPRQAGLKFILHIDSLSPDKEEKNIAKRMKIQFFFSAISTEKIATLSASTQMWRRVQTLCFRDKNDKNNENRFFFSEFYLPPRHFGNDFKRPPSWAKVYFTYCHSFVRKKTHWKNNGNGISWSILYLSTSAQLCPKKWKFLSFWVFVLRATEILGNKKRDLKVEVSELLVFFESQLSFFNHSCTDLSGEFGYFENVQTSRKTFRFSGKKGNSVIVIKLKLAFGNYVTKHSPIIPRSRQNEPGYLGLCLDLLSLVF